MNNTHYALINEDNNVVAVIKKDNLQSRVISAINDETGSEVESILIKEDKDGLLKVKATLNDQFDYTALLKPTWEY